MAALLSFSPPCNFESSSCLRAPNNIHLYVLSLLHLSISSVDETGFTLCLCLLYYTVSVAYIVLVKPSWTAFTLTKAWMVSKFIRSMGRSMINSTTVPGPPPNTKAWVRFRPLPRAEIVGRSIINEHYSALQPGHPGRILQVVSKAHFLVHT